MRFRVTVAAAVAVLAVLVVAGAGLVVAQRRLLTEGLDESLAQSANEAAAAVADGVVALPGGPDDDAITQVVAPDGAVVAASANLAGAPPVAAAPLAGDQVLRQSDGVLAEPGPARLLSRRLDSGLVVHVAAPLDDVEESTRVLVGSLAATVPTVTALLAGLVWILVGRTLRPVEGIRAEVAAIGGTELDRRVPVPPGDDEIARLARTMNAMLDRVAAASQRQQRFTADAAHELRSPLTRMRAELEVDLAAPERADLDATHRSVLEEAVGLQRLVEDLLALARSDGGAGVLPDRRASVDLDDLVLRRARALRAEARVAVDVTGVGAVQVVGDADQLGRAVDNLLDNAARHATSTVTCTLVERDGVAVLAVADDGPGIPADQRDRVFQRFARLDDSRTGATGGTGLGLAIVRAAVSAHSGTVAVDPTYGPGARIVVTLPLPAAPAAHAGA